VERTANTLNLRYRSTTLHKTHSTDQHRRDFERGRREAQGAPETAGAGRKWGKSITPAARQSITDGEGAFK
jgi:hypothetical protein